MVLAAGCGAKSSGPLRGRPSADIARPRAMRGAARPTRPTEPLRAPAACHYFFAFATTREEAYEAKEMPTAIVIAYFVRHHSASLSRLRVDGQP
jgi:hypothetical protein